MKLRYLGAIAAVALVAACDSPLDVNPQQQLPQDQALRTAEEIRVAANAMYDALQTCDGGYCRNMVVWPDLYADDLDFTGTYTTDREVWNRDVRPGNNALAGGTGMWGSKYRGINRANNVLQALPTVGGLPSAEATRLEGEARFIRALNYFDLLKFFGGVPLITVPSWQAGEDINVARSSAADVWAFIEAELTMAIPMLSTTPSAPGRASRWAARALLARAHLYQGEWLAAHTLADQVIEDGPFALTASYAQYFERGQTEEAILELPFSVTDQNALAFWFFPRALGGRRGFAPTASLVAAFPAGDERAALAYQGSGSSRHGRKYTEIVTGADNVPILRLAEMYLIRAEAAARLGLLEDAIDDLNVLRERAGAPLLDADGMTQTQVLLAVLAERRLELFYEGHRFFDLRRFMDVPSVGSYMQSLGLTGNRLLFPIPQREIDANSALQGNQNPGY